MEQDSSYLVVTGLFYQRVLAVQDSKIPKGNNNEPLFFIWIRVQEALFFLELGSLGQNNIAVLLPRIMQLFLETSANTGSFWDSKTNEKHEWNFIPLHMKARLDTLHRPHVLKTGQGIYTS